MCRFTSSGAIIYQFGAYILRAPRWEKVMRVLRGFIVVIAIALGGLLIASPAFAQVNQISFGQPRLGPQGAFLFVRLSVTCDVGNNLAFGDVNVAQASGHRLARGSGFFTNNPPGVPCTGAPQAIAILVSDISSFTFHTGKAAATADVTVFNPVTTVLVTKSVGPRNIRITK